MVGGLKHLKSQEDGPSSHEM